MKSQSKKRVTLSMLGMLFIAALLILSACSGGEETTNTAEKKTEETAEKQTENATEEGNKKDTVIMFGDASWNSIRFHNALAKAIVEKGYGYSTEVTTTSSDGLSAGLKEGLIDVNMEVWTKTDEYKAGVESGQILEVSQNFTGKEAWYVPSYVINGDTEKGIDPMAPDLKTPAELAQYASFFQDPDDPSKGLVVGALESWNVNEESVALMDEFALQDTFHYKSPATDTALAKSLVDAYENGKAWVGYYWEPTAVMGRYDMVSIYDFEPTNVMIAVHAGMTEKAPDVVAFLKNYKAGSKETSIAMAHMEDSGASADETAVWFLKNKEEIWTQWVPAEIVEKVKSGL